MISAPSKAETKEPVTKGEPVIEINHLKIAFGNQPVLNDLSINLYKGENLVIPVLSRRRD